MKMVILVLTLLLFSGHMQAAERMNVLFIVLDDLNDNLGVMGGHPQAATPNMDKLAKEGISFANAHSNAQFCRPSRVSFMMGLYPSTMGYFGKWNKIDAAHSKSIEEYAAENGYRTYRTGKIWHDRSDERSHVSGQPSSNGPLAWDGKNFIPHPSVPAPLSKLGFMGSTIVPLSEVPPGGWRNYHDKSPFRYVSETDRDKLPDEMSVQYVCDWIDDLEAQKKQGKTTPFFMMYGGMKPHSPFNAPKKYYDMFPWESLILPQINEKDLNDTHAKGKGHEAYKKLIKSYPIKEEGLKRYLQARLACIAFADEMVGAIVKKIENSSFRDNTMIVLTSDHGFHHGEKLHLQKTTLWEECTRIPLIIKAPGFKQAVGSQVKHPVSLVDLYPTFKDLCGWTGDTMKNDKGAPLDGHSLRSFLEGQSEDQWSGPDSAFLGLGVWKETDVGKMNYALRSTTYRYIRYTDGKEELYDHRRDPNEWKNIASNPENQKLMEDFRDELTTFVPELMGTTSSK
jgi:arylsulfatase A-like enzyme